MFGICRNIANGYALSIYSPVSAVKVVQVGAASAKPLDRAMLSHRLGRRWQLSAVCMALHDAYKGSSYFHRVGQSAGVILLYRNDHNIAQDFVALCKLVLNNLCPCHATKIMLIDWEGLEIFDGPYIVQRMVS